MSRKITVTVELEEDEIKAIEACEQLAIESALEEVAHRQARAVREGQPWTDQFLRTRSALDVIYDVRVVMSATNGVLNWPSGDHGAKPYCPELSNKNIRQVGNLLLAVGRGPHRCTQREAEAAIVEVITGIRK